LLAKQFKIVQGGRALIRVFLSGASGRGILNRVEFWCTFLYYYLYICPQLAANVSAKALSSMDVSASGECLNFYIWKIRRKLKAV